MSEKQKGRIRRAKKSRGIIRRLRELRLSVHKTANHIYAQIISPVDGKVLAVASTVDKALKLKTGGNVDAAKVVGKTIAERAKKAGVSKVAFDRSGFKYHGRVKALADAAREAGLDF